MSNETINEMFEDLDKAKLGYKDIINNIFKEGGALSQLKPGYKERPIQIEAATKLNESLYSLNEKAFIMEGECGTGKSFAYLLPILDKIARNGFNEKLVVVTSNISLQEQLAFRDVPFALDVIKKIHPETPSQFSGVLFKGRQNFLCNKKLKDLIADSYVDGYDIKGNEQFKDIVNWSYDTKEGDLTELSFVPNQDLLPNLVCLEADECIGTNKCECGSECYYAKHKSKIYSASVIITNYHMLFTDLNMDSGNLLPAYDYIVFDECHELADIYRDFKTESVSLATVRWLAKKTKEMLNKDKEVLGYYQGAVDLTKLLGFMDDFLIKIKNTYSTSKFDEVLLLDNLDLGKMPSNDSVLSELERLLTTHENIQENLEAKVQYLDEDVAEELQKALNISLGISRKIQALIATIKSFSPKYEVPDDKIEWIDIKHEKTGEHKVALSQKPLSVAQGMVDNFYTRETLKCVFASATISVGGSMDYFKSQVGLDLIDPKLSSSFIGGSPFNMKEQQLWYLPTNAVEGNKTVEFNQKLPVLVGETIKACRGGTLALFTSYKNMQDTYNNVRFDLPRGIRVLKQGDMPRMKLLEEFAQDENSVLFATRSFFTGVDVPGKALRCLIIDKFPFPQPTDPVQQKLSFQKDSFFKYSIPEMIITLKQAVGRGVRSVDDKCVICVLDNRMATARYKVRVSNSFNYDKTATRDLSVVEKFIDDYIGTENNFEEMTKNWYSDTDEYDDEMPF